MSYNFFFFDGVTLILDLYGIDNWKHNMSQILYITAG